MTAGRPSARVHAAALQKGPIAPPLWCGAEKPRAAGPRHGGGGAAPGRTRRLSRQAIVDAAFRVAGADSRCPLTRGGGASAGDLLEPAELAALPTANLARSYTERFEIGLQSVLDGVERRFLTSRRAPRERSRSQAGWVPNRAVSVS